MNPAQNKLCTELFGEDSEMLKYIRRFSSAEAYYNLVKVPPRPNIKRQFYESRPNIPKFEDLTSDEKIAIEKEMEDHNDQYYRNGFTARIFQHSFF